jgi:hypothetical protein
VIKISVRLDIQRARREFAGDQKEVTKAALRALDRVSTTARKGADQEIRQRVTLKSGTIKNALTIVYPYGRLNLIRDLVATGKPIALREYQARQTRAGVTFAIVKGRRRVYKRQGRAAFEITKYGKHVFVRLDDDPPGPAKARIKKVYGPSITQRFMTKRVQHVIKSVIDERWRLEFDREMKFRTSKL